jgi:aerobic-type carbon monoxide dehydrogenase small subunit (CoxS/CutS family)
MPALPRSPQSPAESDPAIEAHGVPISTSRRSFIQTLGLSAAGAAIGGGVDRALARESQDEGADAGKAAVVGPAPFAVALRVNGQDLKATIDPATTLMEALRWHFNLTGTKEICDRGACGGCSVLVDGTLVNSCMMLAVDAAGCEVTTIEGLAQGDKLDPIQEAFCRHDALQCGYCTPGLIMASKALLNDHRAPTLEHIKRGLSGNICRCGTYTNVFNAVLEASGQPVIVDAGGRQ